MKRERRKKCSSGHTERIGVAFKRIKTELSRPIIENVDNTSLDNSSPRNLIPWVCHRPNLTIPCYLDGLNALTRGGGASPPDPRGV